MNIANVVNKIQKHLRKQLSQNITSVINFHLSIVFRSAVAFHTNTHPVLLMCLTSMQEI